MRRDRHVFLVATGTRLPRGPTPTMSNEKSGVSLGRQAIDPSRRRRTPGLRFEARYQFIQA